MKKSILALTIATLSILNAQTSKCPTLAHDRWRHFFTKDLVGEGINLKVGWHYGDYDYNMVTLGGGYNFCSKTMGYHYV